MSEFNYKKYVGSTKEHNIIYEHCGHCPEDLQDEEPVVEASTTEMFSREELKDIYDAAVEIITLARLIKEEAGRRPVPGGKQYGNYRHIADSARHIKMLADRIYNL